MNGDFVELLALQLREAAERQERGGFSSRRLAAARGTVPRLRLGPVIAGLAAAAVLAAVVLGAIALRPEPEPAAPKVVARFTPARSLGAVAPGFGAAWLAEPDAGRVLRVDPSSRKVTARIAAPDVTSLTAGAGAVWALTSGPDAGGAPTGALLRIDPATTRIVARVSLPAAVVEAHASFAVVGRGVVWAIGPSGAVVVDPHTNRIAKRLSWSGRTDGAASATLRGADLWVVRDDGGVMRFDARTGVRLRAPRAPATGRVANVGGALVLVGYQEAVRFDPATGRALWHARLGRTGPAAVAQGRLWVATSDPGRPADRLVALDPRTGRVVASVAPREFSPAGLARIGSELWMTTPGGRVVVMDPGG